MSFWTMAWIGLGILGLYIFLVILTFIIEFIGTVISLFSKPVANPIEVRIETREASPSRTRLQTLQSADIHPQYRIEYADVHGEISERDIYIFKANESYLESWCFKADDRRTFRIDRLLAAVDLSTGQPINSIRSHWTKHH